MRSVGPRERIVGQIRCRDQSERPAFLQHSKQTRATGPPVQPNNQRCIDLLIGEEPIEQVTIVLRSHGQEPRVTVLIRKRTGLRNM